MGYLRELLERADEGASVSEDRDKHDNMRSVHNLETIINEGLRVALLEETPDQSLEVLLEHLGKVLDGERTYILREMSSAVTIIPMNGQPTE